MIRRLTVIGVGLIGGSLARALRAAGQVEEIIGCGRSEAHLERALALRVIDGYATSPEKAVAGADMVVVCTPVSVIGEMGRLLLPALEPHAVVTDAGSVKRQVVEQARTAFGERMEQFVPGHPIAGTEHSGVEASFATLYRDRQVILTPTAETRADAVARVTLMWEATGATVKQMTPEHHDRVLAATSHMPHVLAYTLVDTLASGDGAEDVFSCSGGGFADYTRIASSDPGMWTDIMRANRQEIMLALDGYIAHLAELRKALGKEDDERVHATFARARQARERFLTDRPGEEAGEKD